eukprot:g1166.t1
MVLESPVEISKGNAANIRDSVQIKNDVDSNEIELRSRSRRGVEASRKKSSNSRLRASDDLERSSKRQRTELHRIYKTPVRVLSIQDVVVLINEVLNNSEHFNLSNEFERSKGTVQLNAGGPMESRGVLHKKLRELNLHLRLSELQLIFQTISQNQFIQFIRFLSPIVSESETLLNSAETKVSADNRWILLCSLEAVEIILRLLSSPHAPLQLQQDSIIETTVHIIGVHLRQILAYQLSGLTSEAQISLDIQFMNSMELVLMLFESFIRAVPLDTSILVPFVRILLQILEVELPDHLVFIRNAVLLLVSISKRNPDLQAMISEELLSIMIAQSSSETECQSSFQISDAEQDCIHTTTALLLLMIQASVALPEVDCSISVQQQCLGPAYRLSEDFWNQVFSRLALVRTDGVNESKQVMERLINDLLCVLVVPEYPAANLLLMSFVKIVISQRRGLDHSSPSIRMISLSLLGSIALKLCKLSIIQHQELPPLNLQALKSKQSPVNRVIFHCVCGLDLDNWGVEDSFEIGLMKMAVLDHLGRLDPINNQIWKLGHSFVSCSLWNDRLWRLNSINESRHEDHELNKQLLVRHIHYTNQTLDRNKSSMSMSLDVQPIIGRLLFTQGLGQLKKLIIKAIASTGNKSYKNAQQNATLRARSMKCLNALIELDTSILSQDDVKNGVHSALMDSAISVRESALELIGQYIGNSEELIMQYYYLLIKASQDPGVSVKKRGLKLLYEICVENSSFQRRTETLLVILLSIEDPEEQIQTLVCRIFNDLWFSRSNIKSSVKDMCALMTLVRSHSNQYHLHLPSVVLLRLILVQQRPQTLEMGQKMTTELFKQLLDDSVSQDCIPIFMTLHVLCSTNVYFLIPEEEPCRYIFILHPYLVELIDSASNTDQLFILLEIFSSLLNNICHHLTNDQLSKLKMIFNDLMTKHSNRRVLSSACRCLCTLANRTLSVGIYVHRLMENYSTHLKEKLKWNGEKNMDPSTHRLLFLLGQICKNCPGLMERASSAGLEPYLELFMNAFTASNDVKLKECALEGILLMMGTQSKFLKQFSRVDGILKEAICERQTPSLQKTALRSLTMLLKTEDELAVHQQQHHRNFRVPETTIHCTISNGIIQSLWSEICSCLVEVNGEKDQGSCIRSLALDLIRFILQGGLIAPWLSVPYLIALTTDPVSSISSKALTLLKSVKDKQNALFIKEALTGLSLCFSFHSALQDISQEGICLSGVKGFGCFYESLIQSSAGDSSRVLTTILKPFDLSVNLSLVQPAPEFAFLLFSAQIIVSLQFQHLQEVLSVIRGAQDIISLRSESILSNLKEQSELPIQSDNIKLSKAAASLALLVNFRNFIKNAYSVRQRQIDGFKPGRVHRLIEEKIQFIAKKPCRFTVKLSDYETTTNPIKLQDQYFYLESLLMENVSDEEEEPEDKWMPQSKIPPSSTASDEVSHRMKLRSRK